MVVVAALLMAGCGWAGPVRRDGGSSGEMSMMSVVRTQNAYTRPFSVWSDGDKATTTYAEQTIAVEGDVRSFAMPQYDSSVDLMVDDNPVPLVASYEPLMRGPTKRVFGSRSKLSLKPGAHVFKLKAVNGAAVDQAANFTVTVTELEQVRVTSK
jgi:hypothetical protein